MTDPYAHRIALLADPHVHATHLPAIGPAIRPLDEVTGSTRVFNESLPAFRAALDGIVERGIRLVLILGDLTGDGMETELRLARGVLAEYEARGLRFLMVPGNHDMFGMKGRYLRQGYVVDGQVRRLSGDPGDADHEPMLRMLGYPEALPLLDGLGFTPDPRDLHWESPFGTADWAGRTYGGQIDASYLVEPEPDLWILSLDANHFVPGQARGAIEPLADPNHQGWAAVLRDRPYLADWMTDVARRAKAGGKRLIAMSHYAMIDPADRALGVDLPLKGGVVDANRAGVVDALRRTGIGRVMTAHFHVDSDQWAGGPDGMVLANHAVPSPVTWPGAWRSIGPEGLVTHPVRPTGLPDLYDGALPVGDYGDFLWAHQVAQLPWRYYATEWPEDALARLDGADILGLPAREVVQDWYALRKGGAVDAARMRVYARTFADPLTGLTRRLTDFVSGR